MADEMDVADEAPEAPVPVPSDADMDAPVETQHAFLDQAKAYNFVAVKDMVLAQPSLVNAQPCGRWSALHQAAEAGDEAAVRFLLDHGADTAVKTKDGRTPFQVSKNAAVRALLGGPAKRAAPEAAPDAGFKALKFEPEVGYWKLTVNYAASGELLKAMDHVNPSLTVKDLKSVLKETEGLGPGKQVAQILKENYPLGDDMTLSAAGLADGSVLNAVVKPVPVLHLQEACSYLELSEKAGDWMCGDEQNLVDDEEEGKHADLATAPPVAKEVATAINEAAPGLSGFVISKTSEGSEPGEVIVISSPGEDPKKACLMALAIRQEAEDEEGEMLDVWSLATLDKVDMKDYLTVGFNAPSDVLANPDELDMAEEEKKQILAATQIMSEKLENHFCFNFTDAVVTAPVIWGGYAADGSIVGVMSSRVWT